MAVSDNYLSFGNCLIDSTAQVRDGAIIGKQYRPLIGFPNDEIDTPTVINRNVYVGFSTIIGAGSVINEGAILDDFSVIECEVRIGADTLVTYRSQVCNEAQIGMNCVIGGFVAEKVVIGDRSRVFGQIVHSHHNPTAPWDDPQAEEASAVIESDVFVGFNAIIAGGVRLEKGSYVCAGAIVTKDVPSGHVAYSVNQIVPATEWKGPLNGSNLFKLHGIPPQGSTT